MGKYVYSLGNAGLWEKSRPIVWPLMLGFLWKIGLDVVLFGRILEILFGSLCVLLTYVIGKKIFDEKTALLASAFLAISPAFFFFNGTMLTEIISTFFSLLGIYFFINKKYLGSGAFFGTAFITRFLQLFVFIAIILVITIFDRKNIKKYAKLIAGFIVATVPYLILNQIAYNNTLFPFLQQLFLSKNTGWLNYQPISYYFIELFKENFLYLFFIVGILLVLKGKGINKKIITFVLLLFFIFFNSINQKEMRFLIVLFPYMYLLVAFSIIYFIDKFKNNASKYAVIFFIIVSFFVSTFTITTYYKNEINKADQYAFLQDKLEKANGKIWISSPIISVFSNRKVDTLVYYPLFNTNKKKELMEEIVNADFIFIDTCDLACKPFDKECENNKNELITYFKQQLKTVYSSKINSGMRVSEANSLTTHCEQFALQR